MKRPYTLVIIALLAVVAVELVSYNRKAPEPGTTRFDTQLATAADRYIVYVGLRDKDTGTELVTLEEAKRRLKAVASRHVDGFTVRNAEGYWTNEAGEAANENTLIYDFLGAGEEQIAAIAKEMKAAMNQESVLVEKSKTLQLFY